MAMRYFKNPNDSNKVYGYDSATQASLVAVAVAGAWTEVTGSWPPPAPAPTLAQQAAALLSGTVTVTSASTPSLNGTYTITAADQAHLDAEIVSILLNGTFADGTSTVEWPDTANPPVNHAFTVAQFKTFASAIAAFVAACSKCINGVSTTLPSNQLSIP